MLWSALLDSSVHAHAPEHRRDRGRLLRGDRGGPRGARTAAQAGSAPPGRAHHQAPSSPRVHPLPSARARAFGHGGGRDLRDVHDALLRARLTVTREMTCARLTPHDVIGPENVTRTRRCCFSARRSSAAMRAALGSTARPLRSSVTTAKESVKPPEYCREPVQTLQPWYSPARPNCSIVPLRVRDLGFGPGATARAVTTRSSVTPHASTGPA